MTKNGRLLPPNLDDRTWQQLVDEAKGLIPTYAPEWTDHNPSDLGITLIELFAWMSEQIIYRLNQVPEKNYIAFLNLLNITRDAAVPAKVKLHFAGPRDTTIPQGTLVSTPQTEKEEAVVFETDTELRLSENGGEVQATNAFSINAPEILGESNGAAFQVFTLKNVPLYLDTNRPDNPLHHLEIWVGNEVWTRVNEFQAGRTGQYLCNPSTGEISFGNAALGGIPTGDKLVRATRYRYVAGGRSGNVPKETLTLLKTPIAGVSVVNPEPAAGGLDWEPIEDTLRRAPLEIKTRARAVTAEDYEFLAREAAIGVAKAKCLGPKKKNPDEYETEPINRSPGKAHVILVPNVPFDPNKDETRKPLPDPDLVKQVLDYLEARRVLTSELFLYHPFYVEIGVTATVYVAHGTNEEARNKIAGDVKNKLLEFLHPVSGGVEGRDWEIGQDLYLPQIFDLIRGLPEIRFVESLQARRMGESEAGGIRVALKEYEMVCAADAENFIIEVKEEPQTF